MGVSANLGTKVNRRKRAIRLDPNIVKNVSPKRGDKRNGVVMEIINARKEAKEVVFYKFFLWDPKFLTMVIDNGILMGVTVDGEGAGRSVEKIWRTLRMAAAASATFC